MIGLNEYIDIKVLTQKGIVSIKDVNIGDKVYEFGTSKMLEVLDIVDYECGKIYEMTFNDYRDEFRMYGEVMPREIKQTPLEFNPDIVKESLDPDPYTAGPLLIYGEYDNKYICLPYDLYKESKLYYNVLNEIRYLPNESHKTHIMYQRGRKEMIRWDELFPKYNFYAKTRDKTSPPIPKEYMYASVKDRIQFIRGVFDFGYNIKRFPTYVGIEHESEHRLLLVQEMLWSLGVPSKIEYDPTCNIDTYPYTLKYPYNRKFRLRILGDKQKYPGFFYKNDNIEQMIKENTWEDKLQEWKLNITKTKYFCIGYMKNIVLEKPSYYYTSSFLPRMSL